MIRKPVLLAHAVQTGLASLKDVKAIERYEERGAMCYVRNGPLVFIQ